MYRVSGPSAAYEPTHTSTRSTPIVATVHKAHRDTRVRMRGTGETCAIPQTSATRLPGKPPLTPPGRQHTVPMFPFFSRGEGCRERTRRSVNRGSPAPQALRLSDMLTLSERRVLGAYCSDHAVATCEHC